jgi:hypothetical protein
LYSATDADRTIDSGAEYNGIGFISIKDKEGSSEV